MVPTLSVAYGRQGTSGIHPRDPLFGMHLDGKTDTDAAACFEIIAHGRSVRGQGSPRGCGSLVGLGSEVLDVSPRRCGLTANTRFL